MSIKIMNTVKIDNFVENALISASTCQTKTCQFNRFYDIRIKNVEDDLITLIATKWPGVPLYNIQALTGCPPHSNIIIYGTVFKNRPQIPTVLDSVFKSNSFNGPKDKEPPFISPKDVLFLEDGTDSKIELNLSKECGLNINTVLFGTVLCVKGYVTRDFNKNVFVVNDYTYPPTLSPPLIDKESFVINNPIIFVSCPWEEKEEDDDYSVYKQSEDNTMKKGPVQTSAQSLHLKQSSIKEKFSSTTAKTTTLSSSSSGPSGAIMISIEKPKKASLKKAKPLLPGQKDIRGFFTHLPKSTELPEIEEKHENIEDQSMEMHHFPLILQQLAKYLESFKHGYDLVFIGGVFPSSSKASLGIEKLDNFCKLLLQKHINARIFLFPGAKDCVGQSFPVRPLPPRFFKHSCDSLSHNSIRFHSLTNPALLTFNNFVTLQMIDACFLKEPAEQSIYKDPLIVAQHLIKTGSYGALAPDTIDIKPGLNVDIFCIKQRPHFLVIGEQEVYEKMTIFNGETVIVTVPKFSTTQTIVVLNSNLQLSSVKINSDGSFNLDSLSEYDKLLQGVGEDMNLEKEEFF